MQKDQNRVEGKRCRTESYPSLEGGPITWAGCADWHPVSLPPQRQRGGAQGSLHNNILHTDGATDARGGHVHHGVSSQDTVLPGADLAILVFSYSQDGGPATSASAWLMKCRMKLWLQ